MNVPHSNGVAAEVFGTNVAMMSPGSARTSGTNDAPKLAPEPCGTALFAIRITALRLVGLR